MALINSQEREALAKPQPSQQAHQHKKPSLSADAFPALSSAAAPPAPAQWITVSKGKEKPRARVEPPPPPREPAFNPVADFPTLPANKAKPKKIAMTPAPRPNPPPPQPDPPKPTKKDRKKQSNTAKKENISELAYVNGVIDGKIARELSYASEAAATPVERKIKTVESSSAGTGARNGGTGDFKMTARDYPPLNPRSDNAPAPQPQPQPRPAKKIPNGKISSVPPGFERPTCDGMTFTNSSGQTFPAPVHAYIPPPDFEQRNRALVKKFAVALGGAAAVEDFKVASRAFRDDIISAEEFYQHCRSAVGSQLDTVFPELVALLPDIRKQQELVVGRNMGSALEVCSTCGQLVVPRDHIAHDTAHWPALSSR